MQKERRVRVMHVYTHTIPDQPMHHMGNDPSLCVIFSSVDLSGT